MEISIPEAMQKAIELHGDGQLQRAEQIYNAVLKAAPNHAQALHLLGTLKYQQGALKPADDLMAQAIALKPDFVDAFNSRGVVLRAMRRPMEALALFDRALAMKPDHLDMLNNRGMALMDLLRPAEALESFERALALGPDHVIALNNRGMALMKLQRPAEAVESFDRALKLAPNFTELLNNRAEARQAMLMYKEALLDYARALAIGPDYAQAHVNRSLALITSGDYINGWLEYEWRRKTNIVPVTKKGQRQPPLWIGQSDIAGKTIMIFSEQGFGDTIQFARYAEVLSGMGAKVILLVQQSLKDLFSGLTGVEAVIARGDDVPPYDMCCPLMSLPLALGTTLDTIPANIPYIHPNPELVEQWRQRIALEEGQKLVGITCSGKPSHKNDHNRSIPISTLAPLFGTGARFVIIQNSLRAEDSVLVKQFPEVLDLSSSILDFADTAAICELADVVISVDTAALHVAAGMGKPVWVMLPYAPDWRWLLGREDSPWYPTARLFRQPAIGDWRSVVQRVADELKAKVLGQRAGDN